MDYYNIAYDLVMDNEYFLPTGHVLRFTEEQDTDTSVNDFECYGRVEYVATPYDRNGMRRERPEGFDGLAEKIVTPRGDTYWWQPTLDLWGIEPAVWHTDPELRSINLSTVMNILTYGFVLYTVELFRPCGECGTEKLVAWEAMGGNEPFMNRGDVADVVSDLIARLPWDKLSETSD
jgi:hypothetical protein